MTLAFWIQLGKWKHVSKPKCCTANFCRKNKVGCILLPNASYNLRGPELTFTNLPKHKTKISETQRWNKPHYTSKFPPRSTPKYCWGYVHLDYCCYTFRIYALHENPRFPKTAAAWLMAEVWQKPLRGKFVEYSQLLTIRSVVYLTGPFLLLKMRLL